jgi:hypothetical protein
MKAKKLIAANLAGVISVPADPVLAWGDEGHEITRYIASALLTPRAKSAVGATLTNDDDTQAAPDFGPRASVAYNPPPHAACSAGEKPSQYPSFMLPDAYQTKAAAAAQTQLQKAGLRLAAAINNALN